MITENENRMKTPTGWWHRISDSNPVRKIHNEIELTIRWLQLKPFSYNDRTNDLGVFHFGKRGVIFIHKERPSDPSSKVLVRFVRDGHKDLDFNTHKEEILFRLLS